MIKSLNIRFALQGYCSKYFFINDIITISREIISHINII